MIYNTAIEYLTLLRLYTVRVLKEKPLEHINQLKFRLNPNPKTYNVVGANKENHDSRLYILFNS